MFVGILRSGQATKCQNYLVILQAMVELSGSRTGENPNKAALKERRRSARSCFVVGVRGQLRIIIKINRYNKLIELDSI